MYAYDAARTHLAFFPVRPPYRRIWTVRTGYYIEFPPSVAYGRVFVAQLRGRFFAIDAKTGEVIWEKRFRRLHSCVPDGRGPRHLPAVRAQALRLRSAAWPRRLHRRDEDPRRQAALAVPRLDRSRRCSCATASSTSAPGTATSTRCACGTARCSGGSGPTTSSTARRRTRTARSTSGRTAARSTLSNARTGRMRWRARSFSSRRFGREQFYATPTVAYGRVFVGNSDGFVYAFGATTGRLLWARRIGNYVYSAAAIWREAGLRGLLRRRPLRPRRVHRRREVALPGRERRARSADGDRTASSTSRAAGRAAIAAGARRSSAHARPTPWTGPPASCSGAFPTAATHPSSRIRSGSTSRATRASTDSCRSTLARQAGPQVLHQAADVRLPHRAGEREGACREHPRALGVS